MFDFLTKLNTTVVVILIIAVVLIVGLAMVLGRDFQSFYEFVAQLFGS